MTAAHQNTLFYGNNLKILREHVDSDSVDLVYLDPPFKSNQDYNLLFRERDGSKSASQIQVFADTWTWDEAAALAYEEVVVAGGRVSLAMQAFRTLLGQSDMMAYLSMMAPRLVELQRVLKSTGSIYLHCDPTASHYLKLLMDAVFEPVNFKSEIIWRRTGAHGGARRFAPIHDTILFYTKTSKFKWRRLTRPYMRGHIEENFVQDAQGWRTNYYGNVLTGSGRRNGESGKPWRGFDPDAKGRHWAVPSVLYEGMEEEFEPLSQHEKMERLLALGFIKIVPGQDLPIYERRIRPGDGTAIPDIWAFQPYTEGTVFGTEEGVDAEVRWLTPKNQERLGYPTQKPEALLERILNASTEEGDTVLDPFCGCGTAIAVAQRLKRRWIGIDITALAVSLIRYRLRDAFGDQLSPPFTVIGEPTSIPDAKVLAKSEPYQFQWWALGLVSAQPIEKKKGADKGIDGRLYFHDEHAGGKTKSIILSVKAGHVTVSQLRDLLGVLTREDAAIGVLISMEEPTKPMRAEAASAGFYTSPGWGKKYPRLQLLTIAELLGGKGIEYPPSRQVNVTFRKAGRSKVAERPEPGLYPDKDDAGDDETE